jgi:hypothetical protein
VDEVNIRQAGELPTALNDIGLYLFFVLVVLKRESLKRINTLCPTEFWNSEINRRCAKRFAIEIEISTRYTKVLFP